MMNSLAVVAGLALVVAAAADMERFYVWIACALLVPVAAWVAGYRGILATTALATVLFIVWPVLDAGSGLAADGIDARALSAGAIWMAAAVTLKLVRGAMRICARCAWRRRPARTTGDAVRPPPEAPGDILDAADTAAEQKLRTVLEGPAALAMFSGERTLWLNRACAQLFGYDDGDEIMALEREGRGRAQEQLGIPAAPWPGAAAVGAVAGIEFEGQRRGGERFWCCAAAKHVPWEGQPAALATFHDISAQKHLERQLRQSQKMEPIGQLAEGIAHDFNNMLQVISGYARMALAGLPLNHPAAVDLGAALEATGRASTLTRQLLAFGRRHDETFADLDVNDIVRSLFTLLKRSVDRSIELEFHAGMVPAFVHGDSAQLWHVLMNLCLNARDAMPHGGRLVIFTRATELDEEACRGRDWLRPGRFLEIRVVDTGAGIPPEAMPHIFEPFFTTKTAGRGSGLGLSIAHGIAQAHGGFIDVSSVLGEGTTFRLLLPLGERGPRPVQRPPRIQPGGGHETILFADDEPDVRNIAARVLERAGYRVLLASDGVGALRVLDEQARHIDLAILDLVMPRKGGVEVFQELKAAYPAMPVLISTGAAPDRLAAAGIPADCYRLLRKPFDPDDLLRAVREALDLARS